MSATTILAIGKMRGPEAELCAEYLKRHVPRAAVKEFDAPKGLTGAQLKQAEGEKLLAALPDGAFVVALDERGQDVSSVELAQKMSGWRERKQLCFVIGGADGLSDAVKARADFALSLGRKTWPHMLARVMLLEQLYRAQQIVAGHPYHRV